jgi:DNA-binding response OmpR family regulator
MDKHVLVVDDEVEFGELIAHGLKANGFECSLAVNGLEGLDKARRLHPDAVVLDIMLPDLDGFTICELLRRQPSTARIPVVMLTCLGGTMSRMNGLSSGADDYLTKPFKMADLVHSILGAMRHRHGADHAP